VRKIYDSLLLISNELIEFERHEEKNASWEAVKLLPNDIEHNNLNFKVAKRKVEVKYDVVDQQVNDIWNQNPELVIHVGVHGQTSNIQIEKCAANGFCKEDYSRKCLSDTMVCLEKSGKCELLETEINVDRITKHLNENYKPMFSASCDVGQYLCGYIYLKSLDKNSKKCIFIHVPPIDKPFSSEETSRAILKIIEECLSEIV
jgi:pyroglutamyl-peptidase